MTIRSRSGRQQVRENHLELLKTNCQIWLNHWKKILHLDLWDITLVFKKNVDYWATIIYENAYMRATVNVSIDLPLDQVPVVILHECLHIYTGYVRDYVLQVVGKEMKATEKTRMYYLNEKCNSTLTHLIWELYLRMAALAKTNQQLKASLSNERGAENAQSSEQNNE